MKKLKRQIISLLLVLCVCMSNFSIIFAQDQIREVAVKNPVEHEVSKATQQTINNMLSSIANKYAVSENEWALMDMVAHGKASEIDQAVIDHYVETTKEKLNQASRPTDISKAVIIFTALGIDPRNVLLEDGTKLNLINMIKETEVTEINQAVFALLAYDSGNYEVTEGACTRAEAIQYIKEHRTDDHGWTYYGNVADPDMTGMALSALAPYYLANEDIYGVRDIVEEAIELLSKIQEPDGTFSNYGSNACSTAMVVVGLSALGIDAGTDTRFIKNNKSAIEGLVSFETKDHLFVGYDGVSADDFSTEQGYRALVAYRGFVEDQRAFNIYSCNKKTASVVTGTIITEQTKDLTIENIAAATTLVIPSKVNAVLITTPQALKIDEIEMKRTTMPALGVVKEKGNQQIYFNIEKNTEITGSSKWDGKLILPSIAQNVVVPKEKIAYAIKVGGNVDLSLSVPARIYLPGAREKRIGYIGTDGEFNEITNILAEDNKEALTEKQTEGKVVIGDDVAVWTKHFTVFAVLENKKENKPEGGSGGITLPSTNITVSFTLIGDSKHGSSSHKNNETWIDRVSITVPKKATVKDVFEKALDEAGISYVSDGTYVSAINGLKEMDNGPNSGWKYRVNDSEARVAYNQFIVSDGAEIVWYYVDDYKKDHFGSTESGESDKQEEKKEEIKEEVKEEVQPDQEIEETLLFEDISKDHWARESISYLVNRGIIEGRDSEHFAPNEKITRAEFISLLYRMSGQKAENTTVTGFEDVKVDFWFNNAVAWAVEAGITNGVDAKHFAPNQEITREQMAVLLVKYAEYKGLNLEKQSSKVVFEDNDNVSIYAKEAVSTMQQAGIINGREDGKFAPKDKATRAETAKMLALFLQQIEK